jgi:hypothetical protein
VGKRNEQELNNIVVVSDIHAGCRLALCPSSGVKLDDGGRYDPSAFQKKVYSMWRSFWDEWVPEATRKEPYGIVINGDAVEGIHHRATTPISTNPMDQEEVAYQLLAPLVDRCKGRLWFVRGTETHVGQSACDEERLAKRIGSVPNEEGQYARWDLWKRIGDNKLMHLLHHVGTTGSQAYESTAVHKELVEEFIEAARWRRAAPDMIVRSHRHRHFETSISTGTDSGETGRAIAVVTPAWQGKTPHVWKIPGGRLSTPQFGGILARYAHGRLFVDSKVWTVDRSKPE